MGINYSTRTLGKSGIEASIYSGYLLRITRHGAKYFANSMQRMFNCKAGLFANKSWTVNVFSGLIWNHCFITAGGQMREGGNSYFMT